MDRKRKNTIMEITKENIIKIIDHGKINKEIRGFFEHLYIEDEERAL